MNSNNTSFAMVPPDVSLTSAPLKIALLLLTGVSVHFSLTPPNSAAPKTVVSKGSLFERCVTWFTFCSKTLVWIMTLSDAAITYAQAYHPTLQPAYALPGPSEFTPGAALAPRAASALLAPSALMLAGALTVACASVLRQWCFRTLGALFTFEITIQPGHALVTAGPYGIVRHPSYTGIYMTLLGSTAVAFAPGAYLRECWLPAWAARWAGAGVATVGVDEGAELATAVLACALQALVAALVALWFVTSAYALRSTVRRLNFEDRELHRVFGKEWEVWAARVRWKMVPGIY